MTREEMEALVATVTPERLRQLVLELEPQQPEPNRGTVPLFELLEAFSQAAPGMQPADQGRLDTLLRRAIIAVVEPMGDMQFVEGDA